MHHIQDKGTLTHHYSSEEKGNLLKSRKSPAEKILRKKIPAETSRETSRAGKAYGNKIPLCVNADCKLRKGARCLGFEGCPGFRSG